MDGPSPPSISPQDLYRAIGVAASPVVLDVRRAAAFEADDTMLLGALRRDPAAVEQWRSELPPGRPAVAYCVHGHAVSQTVASSLREAGIEARYLEGGIAGWAELGLPRRNKTPA